MKTLFQLISINRLQLVILTMLGLVSGLSSTGLLYVLNMAKTGFDGHWKPFALFVALLIAHSTTYVLSKKILIRHVSSCIRATRIQLMEKIIGSAYEFVQQYPKSEIIAALTIDTEKVSDFYPNLVNIFIALVTILSSFAYLAWISPKGLSLALGVVLLSLLFQRGYYSKGKRNLEAARECENTYLFHLNSLLNGTREIKQNDSRKSHFFDGDVSGNCDENFRFTSLGYNFHMYGGVVSTISFFLIIGFVSFGGEAFLRIDHVEALQILIVLLYMIRPISQVTTSPSVFSMALISAEKLATLQKSLNAKQEHISRGPVCASLPEWKEIGFREVVYYYSKNSSSFKLGPLDFSISKGETIFIKGGNGSGKSTLTNILTGLVAPRSGRLELDGQPVNPALLKAYRNMFTVVSNRSFVFHKPYGLDSQELQRDFGSLLQQLKLPSNLYAEGEFRNYGNLSSGQYCRFALAVSLLENRPILIFDEWAANQDVFLKAYFYEQVMPRLKKTGKTIICITHDDGFDNMGDRIFNLENGSLAAFDHAAGSLA